MNPEEPTTCSSSLTQPDRLRWLSVTWIITVVAALYAYWQLVRVRSGQLFAFPLPWDRAASTAEIIDANTSVDSYLVPAVLCVIVMGGIVSFYPWLRVKPLPKARIWSDVASLFIIAAIADLVTTFWFFQTLGVDHELHPGIRLFSYAYGRTVGLLLAKVLQATGVLLISRWLGKAGVILLVTASLACLAAAIHNSSY